ncbi:MAG: hypothetical protein AAFX06_03005 [Planctomycetota bacterium]
MHRIRLRRPWDLVIDENEPTRVDVPDPPREALRAVYRRSFNTPTSLDDTTQIMLVVESWSGDEATITLNSEQLETGDRGFPLRLEVRDRLVGINRIEITLTSSHGSLLGLDGAVSLEIHDSSDA